MAHLFDEHTIEIGYIDVDEVYKMQSIRKYFFMIDGKVALDCDYVIRGDKGTLQVKNNKGEYVESAVITFYNTPEENEKIEVTVPNTGANNFFVMIAGAALVLGGIAYARKTIKEC